MRRPLVRHLSEGGGGETGRRQSVKHHHQLHATDEDSLVTSNWSSCRDYRRHQSSCDLLKVPAVNPRGRISPEPRITVTGIFNNRWVGLDCCVYRSEGGRERGRLCVGAMRGEIVVGSLVKWYFGILNKKKKKKKKKMGACVLCFCSLLCVTVFGSRISLWSRCLFRIFKSSQKTVSMSFLLDGHICVLEEEKVHVIMKRPKWTFLKNVKSRRFSAHVK